MHSFVSTRVNYGHKQACAHFVLQNMLANIQNRRRECNIARSCHSLQRILTMEFKTLGALNLHTRKLSIFQFRKKVECITESKPRSMNVDYLRDYHWAAISVQFAIKDAPKQTQKTLLQDIKTRRDTKRKLAFEMIHCYKKLTSSEQWFQTQVAIGPGKKAMIATDGWRRKSRQIQRLAEGRKTVLSSQTSARIQQNVVKIYHRKACVKSYWNVELESAGCEDDGRNT